MDIIQAFCLAYEEELKCKQWRQEEEEKGRGKTEEREDKEFLASLTEKQTEVFRRIEDSFLAQAAKEEDRAYFIGFKLGVLTMLEVFK